MFEIIWNKLPELLKSLATLAWPITTIIAIYVFKNPLSNWIKDAQLSIGKDRIDISSRTIMLNQSVEAPGAILENQTNQLTNEPIQPIIRNLIEELRQHLETLSRTNNLSKENILLKELAETRYREFFERSYNQIFGSQINVLLKLREYGPQPINIFYEDHVKRVQKIDEENKFNSQVWTFEKWVEFLLINRFIELNSGIGKITDVGDAFIVYLQHKQYNLNRAL